MGQLLVGEIMKFRRYDGEPFSGDKLDNLGNLTVMRELSYLAVPLAVLTGEIYSIHQVSRYVFELGGRVNKTAIDYMRERGYVSVDKPVEDSDPLMLEGEIS